MAILVGFQAEGHDWLILKSLLARLLPLAEEEILEDHVPSSNRGWEFVVAFLPVAMKRFYQRCAQMMVIGIDNDGNESLLRTGGIEDPKRPRHWNHSTPNAACRFCRVEMLVAETRAKLSPLPGKPPLHWPVLLAVPVEAIEAWILELQAIVSPPLGLVRAEDQLRSTLKQALYQKKEAPKADVEAVALSLIRTATQQQLDELRARSRSFALFVKQVDQARSVIQEPRDCWSI